MKHLQEFQKIGIHIGKNMVEQNKRKFKNAERILKNTFVFDAPWDMESSNIPYTFKDAVDWNLCPFGDEEWTFMLCRFTFLTDLSFAFLENGNEDFIIKGCELISSFINDNPYTEERNRTSYRTLDCAIRINNWISFYEKAGRKYRFSKDFETMLFNSLAWTNEYLISHQRPFLKLSNWGSIGYAYLAKSALLLNDVQLFEKAVSLLCENLSYSILPDGMLFEQSPMYHTQVLIALLDLLKAVGEVKGQMKLIKGIAYKMALAALKSMKPDSRQFLQSDSDDTSLKDVFSYASSVFDDGIFKRAGFAILDNSFSAEERARYESIEPLQPAFLSCGLQSSGNYYLRSGWDKDALVTHFRCGPPGSGHGHLDLLHFDITYGSDDILTDSGRYTYRECEERYELKRSRAHNTILVDGREYAEIENSWAFSDHPEFIQSGCFEFSFGSYASGVSLANYPVIIKREIIQIGKLAVFVFDYIKSAEVHTYTRYFHFDNRKKLVKNGSFFEYGTFFFHPDEKESVEETKTLYSRHYNLLEKKSTLVCKSNAADTTLCAFLTFSDKVNVTRCDVRLDSTEERIGDGYAFSLGFEDDVFDILYTPKNKIRGVDFIKNDRVKGYGRIIVSLNGQNHVIAL